MSTKTSGADMKLVAAGVATLPGKKIVIISGFRIFPMNTGGHIRTGGIALAFARLGHDVTVYSLAGRQPDYKLGNKSSKRTDVIAPKLIEELNLGFGFGLMQAAGRRLNVPRVGQYAALKRGLIPGNLRRALADADVVFCDMPWCPPLPGGKPCILISHNLEHRQLEQGNWRHRQFAAWMKQVEADAPRVYDDIFTCSEEDLAFFRQHDPESRRVMPLVRCGVDPSSYIVPEGSRQRVRGELGIGDSERVVLFSGSEFGPNIEALETFLAFCRKEHDFLKREGLTFLVLGSVSPTAFREGRVIATGRVDHVAPYFAAADAGLNPVIRGSGANIKLFEYLATRLTVISTPFGVRGTELKPDVDYLPYEPPHIGMALARFARERSVEEWRVHAEMVWKRHCKSCDIDELVRSAIVKIPALSS